MLTQDQKQDIFNKVRGHLLEQNAKSMCFDEEGAARCLYRGPDGTKCAIGFLIKDEHYHRDLESKAAGDYAVCEALEKSLSVSINTKTSDGWFFNCLQDIHDLYDTGDWEEELALFARDHDLQVA